MIIVVLTSEFAKKLTWLQLTVEIPCFAAVTAEVS